MDSILKRQDVYATGHHEYASALDQTGSKMFWATVAINNYIVLGADASNAFAEAPPPKDPLYVPVDENYCNWYKH